MSSILTKATGLVLNRNWQAINVRTPQEAFCMMATNVATGLEIEGEDHTLRDAEPASIVFMVPTHARNRKDAPLKAKGATLPKSVAPCQNRQLYGLDLPALLAFAHLAFIASDLAFLKAGEIYLFGFGWLTAAGAVLVGASPLFAAHLAL